MAIFHKSLIVAAAALALLAPLLAEAKTKAGQRNHAAKVVKKPRAARAQTATVQAQGNIQNPNPTNREGANPGVVKPLDAPSSTSPTRKPSEGFTDTIMEGSNI